MRTCLQAFVANEQKAAQRIKRGGYIKIHSLDFDSAEQELTFANLPDKEYNADDFFDKEWIRNLFTLAVETLRKDCEDTGKITQFQIFELYDLSESSGQKLRYDEIGKKFNLPETQVTNYLAYSRRKFREIFLEILREVTTNDEEFREEARILLGVDPV